MLLTHALVSLVLATPAFPDVVAEALSLSRAPDCALCHLAETPARGTVNTPMGVALRSRGLVAYDEGSLRTALLALSAERADSDGDGVTDVEELQAGEDPNVALALRPGAQASPVPPVPEYGCHAAANAASTRGSAAPLTLAVVALFARWLVRGGRSSRSAWTSRTRSPGAEDERWGVNVVFLPIWAQLLAPDQRSLRPLERLRVEPLLCRGAASK